MKKMSTLLAVITVILFSQSVQAKVWRINNTPGVVADFTSGNAALASASVVNDDTLYFEGSSTAYVGFSLSKRLVIIGTGYFISGANSNNGLQANNYSSSIGGGTILFDSTGSGSKLIGLDYFNFSIGADAGSATDNITLTRCNIASIGQYYGSTANTKMSGWKINKCYVGNVNLSGTNEVLQNWDITNNIFTGQLAINNSGNSNNLVRNNVLRSSIYLYSAYFTNNIIVGAGFTATNVTVKNNICIGGADPGFAVFVGSNSNIDNQTDVAVFQGLTGNSTDGQWRLKVASPAIGAGETISSITPDCGAFGTADPYVLSGIPPIPTIYLLTVPASVASNATSMPVTISTKSNN